jgi:uncharacterized protein YjiS (DUF1127 family)
MRKQSCAARAERIPRPVAANEEGATYKRAFIVELSPCQCDVAVDLDAAGFHAPPLDAAGGGWIQRLADRLLIWLQRARQRRQLGALNDSMLQDIGLSRADVERETNRRFWQD